MWRSPWTYVIIFLAIFAPTALVALIELVIHVLVSLGHAANQIGHSVPTSFPTSGG